MNLLILPGAKKQLKKLPKTFQIIITKRIIELGQGRLGDSKKLASYKNIYRLRIGNYRIVYIVRLEKIYVVVVAHRKEVYKILGRLFK